MESTSNINKDNINAVSLEELSEDERQRYLAAQEQFRSQYVMRIKKNRQGGVTRAQEFVVPAFKIKDHKIEVISNVSTQIPDPSMPEPSATTKGMDEHIATLIGRIEKFEKGEFINDNVNSNIPHIKQHEVIGSNSSAAP